MSRSPHPIPFFNHLMPHMGYPCTVGSPACSQPRQLKGHHLPHAHTRTRVRAHLWLLAFHFVQRALLFLPLRQQRRLNKAADCNSNSPGVLCSAAHSTRPFYTRGPWRATRAATGGRRGASMAFESSGGHVTSNPVEILGPGNLSAAEKPRGSVRRCAGQGRARSRGSAGCCMLHVGSWEGRLRAGARALQEGAAPVWKSKSGGRSGPNHATAR